MREAAGMPKQELARRIGKSPPYILMLEAGRMRNGGSLESAVALCRVFGCKLERLVRSTKGGA